MDDNSSVACGLSPVSLPRHLQAGSATPSGALGIGLTLRAWHPFKRETVRLWNEEGGYERETWVPGWRHEPCGPEDVEDVWDGEGEQLRTIISRHKPGAKYPERIFYVRQWLDPSGKVFGKTGLRMTTMEAFARWATGRRWNRYSNAEDAHEAWSEKASQTSLASDGEASKRVSARATEPNQGEV